MMRWMEQCAFIAASRVARGGFLLTAAMDSISFLNPTRVGDTVYVEGQVRGCTRECGRLCGALAGWEGLRLDVQEGFQNLPSPHCVQAACAQAARLWAGPAPRPHAGLLPASPFQQVTAIFGSSVEVMISLWGETPDVGVMFHCGDAYATVVSGEGLLPGIGR